MTSQIPQPTDPENPEDLWRAENVSRLVSREWRINNLYWIIDKAANKVKFQPNPVQREVLDNLHKRNIILKSRQHGITTLFCILWLDTCLFRSNTAAGIVAHWKEDAEKFFRQKVLYAYENLPPSIRNDIPITRRDMNGELTFGNGSRISVSTSHRGGTLQLLHVSEYGPMCAMSPQRASEVKSGALNTIAPEGICVIESTAYGAIGDFYTMAQNAMTMERVVDAGQAQLSVMDYKFHFLPWYRDPVNQIDPTGVPITQDMLDYVETVEAETRVELSRPQIAWYVKKAEEQGDKMKQEHPSTPTEAFEQTVEGAYYAQQIAKLEKDGRLCDLPIIPGIPVNTFWDIGRRDGTAIWFHQHVGIWHHFIDYFEGHGEQIDFYVKALRAKEYIYGRHYWPHDGVVTDYMGSANMTRQEVAEKLGIKPIVLVPVIHHLQDGIDMMRAGFARCRFDRTRCGELEPGKGRGGLPSLRAYQKEYDERSQTWRSFPLKNWATEGADAIRQWAQGYPLDKINNVTQHATKTKGRERNWKVA